MQSAPLRSFNDFVLFDPLCDGLQGWQQPRGLTLERQEAGLHLAITQPDSSIMRSGLQIDGGMFPWLYIRYRAWDFRVTHTHGELFYANKAHGFADQYYVHLPSLELDGQWHELWIHIPSALRTPGDDWLINGPITALRLDLVNEAPGKIEIGEIRLTTQRDDLLVPAEGRCLKHWQEPYAMEITSQETGLRLHITGPDARLFCADVPLDPTAARFWAIRYRAWDFPTAKTTGEIFYANDRHDIVGEHRVPLPSLITDGRWHDLIIDVAEALGPEAEDWMLGGPLRRLRLDLVNEAPGQIEIAFVLTAGRLHVTTLRELLLPPGKYYLLPASAFVSPHEETAEAQPSAVSLMLPPGRYDIWLRLIDLPLAYEALRELYVEGAALALPTTGDSGKFVWRHLGQTTGGTLKFSRPAKAAVWLDALLISDNATAAPADRPVAAWQPVISTVRPVPPKRVRVLRPYWAGDMMACPLPGTRDEATQTTKTLFRRTFVVPADLTEAWLQISVDDYFRLYLNGEKIAENFAKDSWKTPTLLEVTTRLRRGEKNCIAIEAYNAGGPQGVLFELVMNRPDHSFEKIVSDGQWRCSPLAPEGWQEIDFADETWSAPSLQPGPPNPPWNLLIPYVNKTWQPATQILALSIPSFVNAGENLSFSCQLQSEKPFTAGDRLLVVLRDAETSRLIREHEIVVQEEQCRAHPDGSQTLDNLSVPFSPWRPTTTFELTLECPGRALINPERGHARFVFLNKKKPRPLVSRVEQRDGSPRLIVNGQPIFPLFGNTEPRDLETTLAAYRAAGFNVIPLWTDGVGQPQWWLAPDEYDFSSADELILQTLDLFPEALLIPIVWAAPPPWWGERYPEELARFNDGKSWGGYYKSTPSFHSQRWREDAAHALQAYVRHLESMPFAERIVGYWVVGGVSAEWQGWGCHGSAADHHLMDYSTPAQAAFRAYLQRRYPDHPEWAAAGVPSFEARLQRELGLFRDPQHAAPTIAFNEFYSEGVVETMLHCVRAIKEAVGWRKIVGVYYGYSFEYANLDWALQMSGHNKLRRALDSPDLDFLSAPHSYAVRRLGDDMGWMWPAASIRRAGKLCWPDDDSRTPLSGPENYSQAINPAQTQEMIRRNLGKQLCQLTPIGYLALVSGREISSEAIARDFRLTRRAGEFALRRGVRRHAQIAAVIDEESVKYLAYDQAHLLSGTLEPMFDWQGRRSLVRRRVNNLMAELIGYQRSRLARIGAPVDFILISDLLKEPLDYRFYIMLSCFQYNDALLAAVRRQIYERGATVLWTYAPGFIKNDRADVSHMRALTGFRLRRISPPARTFVNITNLQTPYTRSGLQSLSFGVPYALDPLFAVADPEAQALGVYAATEEIALACKQIGRARSFFCGTPLLPPDLLREIARAAGVHIYTDTDDILDANDAFVLLHTSTPGVKTIQLPQRGDVVDVFSRRLLERNVTHFTFEERAETTRLFYTGTADEFLRAINEEGRP